MVWIVISDDWNVWITCTGIVLIAALIAIHMDEVKDPEPGIYVLHWLLLSLTGWSRHLCLR
jgi:hypothetical protein